MGDFRYFGNSKYEKLGTQNYFIFYYDFQYFQYNNTLLASEVTRKGVLKLNCR